MPHPVDVHVGKRMRQRRELKGMPQKELAKKLGISFQQIQKYESGANRVSASKMWELCGVLSVEPSYFFEGLDHGRRGRKSAAEKRQSKYEPDPHSARQVLDLNQNFQKIPNQNVRRQIVQLVKSLA